MDAGFSERRPLEEALAEYQRAATSGSTPLYHFTAELATLEPPPPEIQQLFGALHGNQEATNQFYSAIPARCRCRSSWTRRTSGGSWQAPVAPA